MMETFLSPSQYLLVCTQPAIYLGRRQHLLFLPDYLPLIHFPTCGAQGKER